MTIRFSLCALAIAFVGVMPLDAAAQCEIGDLVCKKFSKSENVSKRVKRAKRRSKSTRRRKQNRSVAVSRRSTRPVAAAASSPVVTGTIQSTANTAPLPTLSRLRPGAIANAPASISNLLFRTGDQVETVTGKCQSVDGSVQRISCALATHRLAMTSEAGAGCLGSLGLREMTFARSEDGRWVNEDSIALCGGRLLRRSEMVPVAVDGQPHYALREAYQMLGGDRTCAAPYLRSRRPLRKTYLPASSQSSMRLPCGTVASR